MVCRRWMSLLSVLLAALPVACRKGEGGRTVPPDGYRSPYLPADPGIAPGSGGGGGGGRVGAVEAAGGGGTAVHEDRPRLHPAARERPYPLDDADRLASDDFEREVLGWMSDPRKGPAVLERVSRAGSRGRRVVGKALRCRDRNVRMQACLVFGNLKGRLAKEDVAALADAVVLDPDPDVRATAAKAFVAIREREAVPALVRSLEEDPFAPARANAAWALGQTGGTGVANVLRKALRDEDTWVRLRAVTALGRLRAREAIADLQALSDDPNSMVRERVREVLRTLGGR